MSKTWSMFNWTTGELFWVVWVLAGIVLEVVGIKRLPIPFTDGTFLPLTDPVERNMERRWWAWWLVVVFLVWLAGHWTDLWPWERNTAFWGGSE